jgi:hypothetical protein
MQPPMKIGHDVQTGTKNLHLCESSSVGRARPCQGRGRQFEPGLSLFEIGDISRHGSL